MGRLNGQIALITGGGSGIGRACALGFAQEGAQVLIGDIRDAEATQTVEMVRQAGGECVAVHCDIADEAQVEAMTARCIDVYGGLTALVANAGTSTRAPLHELTLKDWDRVIRVNLTGTFLCCRAAVRHMMEHGGGSIVTIGSVQSVVISGKGAASYKASKAGILMVTRSLAAEYADYGIRANCVCPGGVQTELMQHLDQEAVYWTSAAQEPLRTYPVTPPLRRSADPAEIANVVAFLASNEASFMTGAAIMVDGGLTAV